MEANWIILPLAAIIPIFIGFLWYNDFSFGKIWMKESNLTKEILQKDNIFKIFGFVYLFSLMISLVIMQITVHQTGAFGMIGGPDMAGKALPSFTAFMTDYGTAFRTFKHGALHGFMSGLFLALPIVGINSLFEHKSWKYIFIHAGYWMVTLMLMGGVICAFI